MTETEDEAIWYSRSRLCQSCENAGGDDAGSYCDHYDMPLYMVARKYKCKHYDEYIFDVLEAVSK